MGAWDDYKIPKEESQGKTVDRTPIEALFRSPNPDEEPEAFEAATRKICITLAKVWHISAVLVLVGLFYGGIFMASSTQSATVFLLYAVVAFFAFMVCETISALIKLLLTKK